MCAQSDAYAVGRRAAGLNFFLLLSVGPGSVWFQQLTFYFAG
jgi:hypothetical protein